MNQSHHSSLSRRGFLLVSAAAGLLVACGRAVGTALPLPIDFDGDTLCVLDGLRLIDFPGPKAQIFRDGRSDPDFYCDTVEMFHVFLADARRAQTVQALYVQDMGETDWFEPRGQWMDARHAFYVRDSSRIGPLGPTLASFSQLSAATTFADAHGGTILRFDEVDADMVALDGGALHDTSM